MRLDIILGVMYSKFAAKIHNSILFKNLTSMYSKNVFQRNIINY